jgi:DHA1 family bicyclomycin/chloramphenicol resistance-like MFS transporter
MAAGGIATLVFVLTDVGGVYTVIGASMVFFSGIGSALAQSMAGALMPFPGNAGAASSLMGVCQMTFAAIAGILAAAALDVGLFADQAMPLAAAMAGLSVAALGLFAASGRLRRAGPGND